MRWSMIATLSTLTLLVSSWANAQTPTKVTFPQVGEKECPIQVIEPVAKDGQKTTAAVRKPPGNGPFPAVIFFHGGLTPFPLDELKNRVRRGNLSRFLAAGYVTAAATFRSRQADPQSAKTLWDCLAVIEAVKKMPEVDAKSVALWGISGGGSLALECAGETQLAASAVEEPATVLFMGMMTAERNFGTDGFKDMMRDPKRLYTPELQGFTRKKVQKIGCPVLIAHGDQHPINKANDEVFIPELKAAKKDFETILYRGEWHGFTGGNGSPEAEKKFFEDCQAFFAKYLATQPAALDPALLRDVPARRDRPAPKGEDKKQ
jgi:dienelactone hydrolase